MAREHEAELVVVGLPVSLDGSEGEQAQVALEFRDRLAEVLGRARGDLRRATDDADGRGIGARGRDRRARRPRGGAPARGLSRRATRRGLTEGSDWRDPYSGDDEAARERERRRAEREARRRERLGERVREGMGTEEAPAAPPPASARRRLSRRPLRPATRRASPASAARQAPITGEVARRRLIALVGVLALAFLAFVVVVAAKKVGGGEEAPAGPPPKARKTISLTIPEGYSRDQVAAVAKKAGLEGDYMKATESFKGFEPSKYGAENPQNLEGFLFPATYELFKNATAKDLAGKQLEAFEQNIEEVDFSYAESKNLTKYDVLMIASMIEREVQVPEERDNVSSVIYNRLAARMPLGIDATIRFEDSNYDEQLLESRLEEDTPYNTRVNAGLPPGPIGSPGLASIEAAANPAKTDFIYFVVKPGTCGEHVFSETDEEHARPRRSIKPRCRPRVAPPPSASRAVTSADAQARGPGPARLALALACDAYRGARGDGTGAPSGATRRSRSRPDDFHSTVRGPRSPGVRGRQRDRAAQGRGARGRDQRLTRRRCGSGPRTRSPSRAAESRPRTPTRPGSSPRCPARPRAEVRSSWAPAVRPARRRGRCGDAGAVLSIWNRTPARAEELAAELGATAIIARRGGRLAARGVRDRGERDDRRARGGESGSRWRARGRPVRVQHLRVFTCLPMSSGKGTLSWTWSTGPRRPLLRPRPGPGERRSSTGSRSSSARGPPRFGSGPGMEPPIETMRRAARATMTMESQHELPAAGPRRRGRGRRGGREPERRPAAGTPGITPPRSAAATPGCSSPT